MSRKIHPLRQKGWLRAESGAWLGTYRVYDLRGRSKRKTVRIGNGDMSKVEARKLLLSLIERDNGAHSFQVFDGPSGYVPFDTECPTWRHLPPSTKGAAGELSVSLDLMRRGWDVFRALSPCASCDLVAVRGNVTLRVEVKCASVDKDMKAQIAVGRQLGKFDVLAVVSGDGSVYYRDGNLAIGKGKKLTVSLSESFDQESTNEVF